MELSTAGIDMKRYTRVAGGQTGFFLYRGIGAFSGTDATVELPVPPGISLMEAPIVTPIGAYNANDQLSINETVTDGVIARPASGSITVTRNSGGTSGLQFSFIIIGR